MFLGERLTVWKVAAVRFGMSIAMVKSLTRTEHSVAIIFWMPAIQSMAGLFHTLYSWMWPPAYVWGWIVVIAFCGTFSHYCMARAMPHADATMVIPMDFLRVPLTARGLADLCRAAGPVHGAGAILNSRPQSVEPESDQSGSRAGRR